MTHQSENRYVSDEERRDFLKALGVGGTIVVGSATLGEVRDAVAAESNAELASIGQAIESDLTGALDRGLLASQQAAFAEEVAALPAVLERGFPEDAPRDEFESVAQAGRPIYDHMVEVGFFESTTEHLPELNPEYLQTAVQSFVGSAALAEPFENIGLTDEEGVDLAAAVIADAEELATQHWIATDKIDRSELEYGETIPPVTRGAAGGALLWFEDLDLHLWQKKILLTEEILERAVGHGRAMSAGFHLMTEGARHVAEQSGQFSQEELAALLSVGFAIQAVSQTRLPEEVYWITEEMRKPRTAMD
jgi:hypothetical protein